MRISDWSSDVCSSDLVMTAVPQAMREGSYGLGATQSETIKRVILPAALPGIVGGVLLAVSRAIGETMIVVVAAGLSANLTANPFAAVPPVTGDRTSAVWGRRVSARGATGGGRRRQKKKK